MELAAVFDPTTSTNGSFTASTLQTGSTLIAINKSYVDIILTFANGDERLVIANDRRAWVFADASAVANGMINWKQENVDYPQTINQLQNVIYIEVYAPTEKVTEVYPMSIQRETLPSLVPYQIGASTLSSNFSSQKQTIWPSSYYGVTCAPQSLGGMGFDHFYTQANISVSTVLTDIPGQYPSTGKTANNGTLTLPSAAPYNVPGPFSKAGLNPVDSATFLSEDFWTLSSTIPWASSNGFTIDGWINPSLYDQFIFGDDNVGLNNKGVYIQLSNLGNIIFLVGNGTSAFGILTNIVIPLNQWTYFACRYNKTASTIEIWINGVLNTSASFSGTPANTLVLPGIGICSGIGGRAWLGMIANLGIILSDITLTQWGTNAILARYMLGEQSLNADIQNAWITNIDMAFDAGNFTSTALSFLFLHNVVNTAGLLYTSVPSSETILHLYGKNTTSLRWDWPALTANNQVYYQSYAPKNPITNLFDTFLYFQPNGGANTSFTINTSGYNILGIG